MEPFGGGRHAEDEWLLASDLELYYHLIEKWLLAETSTAATVSQQTATV